MTVVNIITLSPFFIYVSFPDSIMNPSIIVLATLSHTNNYLHLRQYTPQTRCRLILC